MTLLFVLHVWYYFFFNLDPFNFKSQRVLEIMHLFNPVPLAGKIPPSLCKSTHLILLFTENPFQVSGVDFVFCLSSLYIINWPRISNLTCKDLQNLLDSLAEPDSYPKNLLINPIFPDTGISSQG